jgi:hypothetical protein
VGGDRDRARHRHLVRAAPRGAARGGTVGQDYGTGFETTGRITAWEPVTADGRGRFAYGSVEPPADGRPDYAFEFLVSGRDGGGTVVRFVQSGFLDGTDWDGEYNSFDAGWSLFFENLRSYFAHFRGLRAQNVVTMGWTSGTADTVWPVLYVGLGLAGRPDLGSEVTLTPDGPRPITGVVDVMTQEFLGVRSACGLHRFGAEGADGCGVSAYHYFYGEPVDAAALTQQWQAWLTRLFPVPAGTADAG